MFNVKMFVIALGISFLVGCASPLPVCQAVKGKSTWKDMERCYYKNLKTLKEYNAQCAGEK